jgi:hypothetical protein
MPLHDWFVGGVAIIFGGILILSALFDAAALMNLLKARLLAESIGRNAARWAIAGIGLCLIVMGVLIASGWRMRW